MVESDEPPERQFDGPRPRRRVEDSPTTQKTPETWGERTSRYIAFVESNWKIVGSWAALFLFTVWLWWDWSLQPALWGILLMGWVTIALWFSVKIYYQHIMVAKFPKSYSKNSKWIMRILQIPIDEWPKVKIDGPTAPIYDGRGQRFEVVSDFDIDTLQGKGAWNPDWSQLQLMFWPGFVYHILKKAEEQFVKHSFHEIRALSDQMQMYDMIGRKMSSVLKMVDVGEGMKETEFNAALKKMEDQDDQAMKEYEKRKKNRFLKAQIAGVNE